MTDTTIEIIKVAIGFLFMFCPVCGYLTKHYIFRRDPYEDYQCEKCGNTESYRVR